MGIGASRLRETESTIRIHFPPQPASLAVKTPDGTEGTENISLKTLVESKCRSLFVDFRPVWWLFNGHLQSIYNVTTKFREQDQMWYRRQMIRLSDGGTLGLDFAPAEPDNTPDNTPIIVVQHGLTGGSHEAYLRAILAPACTPVKNGGLGYRAVVVTFRGCAGVPITSPQLYTAGHTDDLRQAMVYISHKYPQAPLLGLGFSLGANVMTRYVAEEGEQSRLSSAVVLACPWNMEENGNALESTFFGKNLWARGMGMNFQKLLRLHEEALRKDPESPIAKAVSPALALKYPTLSKFDDTYTRIVGDSTAPFPFPTVGKYYRWASSDCVLKHIKIPLLAINAEDDPVVRHCSPDGEGNPNIILALTKQGGHLGWFQSGENGIERWFTKPVIEWLQVMGEHVVHERPATRNISVDKDGYLKEHGRGYLGCKEVSGGRLIDGNAGGRGLIETS